ncbi:MAG: hypothetical protein ACM31L_16060 [Actinomycetota bacterium]
MTHASHADPLLAVCQTVACFGQALTQLTHALVLRHGGNAASGTPLAGFGDPALDLVPAPAPAPVIVAPVAPPRVPVAAAAPATSTAIATVVGASATGEPHRPRPPLPQALIERVLTTAGVVAPAHLITASGLKLLAGVLMWQISEPMTTATLADLLLRDLGLGSEHRKAICGKLAKLLQDMKEDRTARAPLVDAQPAGKGRELVWTLSNAGGDWIAEVAGDLL